MQRNGKASTGSGKGHGCQYMVPRGEDQCMGCGHVPPAHVFMVKSGNTAANYKGNQPKGNHSANGGGGGKGDEERKKLEAKKLKAALAKKEKEKEPPGEKVVVAREPASNAEVLRLQEFLASLRKNAPDSELTKATEAQLEEERAKKVSAKPLRLQFQAAEQKLERKSKALGANKKLQQDLAEQAAAAKKTQAKLEAEVATFQEKCKNLHQKALDRPDCGAGDSTVTAATVKSFFTHLPPRVSDDPLGRQAITQIMQLLESLDQAAKVCAAAPTCSFPASPAPH